MSAITPDAYDERRGVENEPLTPAEQKMIARLFSDPTVFPRDFKRWVTDHASDSVDISKSQVHGLVNASGGVIMPPQPFIAQVGFVYFATIVDTPSGSGGAIVTLNNVKCDGKPLIVEFFAPYSLYVNSVFWFTIDSNFKGNVAHMASGSAGGATSPVYVQQQFTGTDVAAGNHNFGLSTRSIQGNARIAGGQTISGEIYAPGFLRISRA